MLKFINRVSIIVNSDIDFDKLKIGIVFLKDNKIDYSHLSTEYIKSINNV